MDNDTVASPGRRAFLQVAGAAAGLSALGARHTMAQTGPTNLAHSAEWDLSWLDGLTGRHKQVFDFGGVDGLLHVVGNYLKGAEEVFGLRYPDVNTVVGIASSGFPINANDALWAKYELGKHWEVRDPATGEWAVRNVFAADPPPENWPAEYQVPSLRRRGTIFWQCNNALNGISEWIAGMTKQEVPAVRSELIAGFLPEVKLVPAHTLLIGLTQERGCTYEKL